jgi:hypothetical protein
MPTMLASSTTAVTRRIWREARLTALAHLLSMRQSRHGFAERLNDDHYA